MAVATLDDRSGRVDVVVYAETLLSCQQVLIKDAVVVVEGTCQEDEFSGGYSVVADRIYAVDAARAMCAKRLVLKLNSEVALPETFARLEATLKSHLDGSCPVVVDYRCSGASGRLQFADPWRVHPTDHLLERLRALLGTDNIAVEYH
jgi:DNA polymerase-3 subunit alpha